MADSTTIESVQATTLVVAVDFLRPDTFVLKTERGAFHFVPGQHVTLGPQGSGINREYSIYSGSCDQYLEFLIRIHPGSDSALALGSAPPKMPLSLAGPYGACCLPADFDLARPVWFVAAGVGIAPFRSIIRSTPGLNYQILHGVRELADAYGRGEYVPQRHLVCTSRRADGHFHGRVTAWLAQHRLPEQAQVFICGHANMVADTYDVLRQQGISSDQLLTEVFF